MALYKVPGDSGELIEHDWSAEEEADAISSGQVELAPTPYEVVGESVVQGFLPGSTGDMVLTIPQRDALIEGGAIQPTTSKPKASASGSKGVTDDADKGQVSPVLPPEAKEA
jgi:hypothetical protein